MDTTEINIIQPDITPVSVNVTTPAPQAVVVNVSAVGQKGDPGPWGIYVHTQSIPGDTWTVTHNLGYRPNVTVVDSAETEVVGDLTYVNDNSLILTFIGAFSGKAYLS